ncbi:MAG: response regulator, partial [Halieaceae bacterium]
MKVLIVDDEPLARDRLGRLLAAVQPDAECFFAGNGEEALEQVAFTEPDLLLLDIRMPGMDGIEVATRLEALANPPAVIFCTAYDEYALEALQHHAVAYLLKPVREAELARALSGATRVNRVQLAALQGDT